MEVRYGKPYDVNQNKEELLCMECKQFLPKMSKHPSSDIIGLVLI